MQDELLDQLLKTAKRERFIAQQKSSIRELTAFRARYAKVRETYHDSFANLLNWKPCYVVRVHGPNHLDLGTFYELKHPADASARRFIPAPDQSIPVDHILRVGRDWQAPLALQARPDSPADLLALRARFDELMKEASL